MNIKKTLIFVLLFAGLSLPSFSVAASFALSPAYPTLSVGQSVTVSVFVSSADVALNASSGVVTFPTDKLQVVSVTKTNSLVSFWIQEPSFSNVAGTVNFEGVIPNPGYTGALGKVIAITFKAKAAGTATVSFASGSILANDGQGTELFKGAGSATVTIQPYAPSTQAPVVTPPPATPTPVATSTQQVTPPAVTSQTESAQGYTLDLSYDNLVRIGWKLVNYVSIFLLIVLVLGGVSFIAKHVWHVLEKWWIALMVRKNRSALEVLIVMAKELRDEVEYLTSAGVERHLSSEEKVTLARLKRLQEKAVKEIDSM